MSKEFVMLKRSDKSTIRIFNVKSFADKCLHDAFTNTIEKLSSLYYGFNEGNKEAMIILGNMESLIAAEFNKLFIWENDDDNS